MSLSSGLVHYWSSSFHLSGPTSHSKSTSSCWFPFSSPNIFAAISVTPLTNICHWPSISVECSRPANQFLVSMRTFHDAVGLFDFLSLVFSTSLFVAFFSFKYRSILPLIRLWSQPKYVPMYSLKSCNVQDYYCVCDCICKMCANADTSVATVRQSSIHFNSIKFISTFIHHHMSIIIIIHCIFLNEKSKRICRKLNKLIRDIPGIDHLPVPKINSPEGADTASGEYTELRSVA